MNLICANSEVVDVGGNAYRVVKSMTWAHTYMTELVAV